MPRQLISNEDFHRITENHFDNQNDQIIVLENKEFVDSLKIWSLSQTVHFKNCFFQDRVIIRFCTKDVIFDNCNFTKTLNLNNCKFEKNAKFWNSTFNDIDFHNTTFKGLADFWSCTFNKKIIFYKTDFLGTTVFSAATFNDAVLFTYTSITKVIIFRGTTFKNGIDLSQAIISGNISLHDLRIEKYKAVANTNDNIVYENYIIEDGIIPFANKRETFRLIKQTYSKNGNEIDSLEFRKREQYTFFVETLHNLKKGNKIGISLQNIFILTFNFISNFFGVSWFVGFLFICFFGGFFFLKSIIEILGYEFTLNYNEWEWEHFKYFFEFLNPTHKVDYIQKENLNNSFYGYDFGGRIFVSYGIYQFIQAFRKYK